MASVANVLKKLAWANRRSSAGLLGGFPINWPYNSISVNSFVFTNNSGAALRLNAVSVWFDSTSGSSSPTVDVRKYAAAGILASGGTSMLSAPIATGTGARTNIAGVLSTTAANLLVPAGSSVGIVLGGTLGAPVGGVITLLF